MRPSNPIFRFATPVVALAGTLCLMMPAYAGAGGQALRQMRLDNPGVSNRQIRFVRNEGWSNRQGPAIGGSMSQFQPQRNLQLNDIGSRLNRFNGQSAFITDNGRARAVSNGLALDLTSSERSIVLGENLFSSSETHTIKVGGEQRTLTNGSKVSAAEYVALQQVLNGGSQGLTVDQNGRGVGGEFSLNSINDGGKTIRAAELVIPERVTASGDFGRHSDGVRVTNDLVNYGSINAYSSNKNVDTARIAARDISNNAGATISTSAEQLNLSLRADRDINNSGSISSSGNLELIAGRSINNHGSFSSNQNITLTGNPDSDLLVNNSGGAISAINGAINVRSADYNGIGNSTVSGGDFFSRELNLFTGQGTTDVFVNQVTGVVNSSGTAAHVSTNTETLKIGTQCLIGDPTYYNVGNIQLTGDIVVGEALAIIASGDITRTAGNTTISAISAANGFDINIIAGADVTTGSGETGTVPPLNTNAKGLVSFTGASLTGGDVNLSGTAFTINAAGSALDSDAGNVTIAAFAATNQTKGMVIIPFGGSIVTQGIGAGDNGAVTIVAGGIGNSIQLGSQILSDAGQGNTGDITIVTAQPGFSSGTSMTFGTNGSITSGNKIVASNTISAASITLSNAMTTNAATILVHAGTGVTSTSFIKADGLSATRNGGNISIKSDSGLVSLSGLLSANGGVSANGGIVLVEANDNAAKTFVLAASANGLTGGTIALSNLGLGGVEVNGIFSASGSPGDGGRIEITSGSFINMVALFQADSLNTAKGGSITFNAQKVALIGNVTASAFGAPDSSINFNTTAGGIKTFGNNLTAQTAGTLALDLSNNTIDADSPTGTGGTIALIASNIANLNNSLATPLILSANGALNGDGGQIAYRSGSTVTTFVGQPTKAPNSATNFLVLSAHAGATDGNGGSITVDVAGNLIVDPAAIDVAFSPSGTAHNGGTINLSAGNAPSSKVGSIVILGDLNVDGINGGTGGQIKLDSTYTKTFVIDGTKTPKNGILGSLSAVGGNISVDSGSGIQLLSSTGITANDIALKASGKGKIYAAKGVQLTSGNLDLTSDTGSITLNTKIDSFGNLSLFTNSSATITNVSSVAGAAGLLKLANGITANKGFNLHSSGRISFQDVTVGTKGNVIITNDAGRISASSFGSINAANGEIIVNAKDAVTGGLTFATGVKVRTNGAQGGDITLAIGEIPKKPLNAAPVPFLPDPAEFTVNNIGRGKTFYGANPTAVTTGGGGPVGPVQVNARRTIIFSNASPTAVFNFIGGGDVTAGGP
jgi:hypothetical protein